MTAKEHYDKHLGNFYSWMVSDFDAKQKEYQQFLETHDITPTSTQIAIDFGAGHGLQSVSLAKLGFRVKAIDFNQQLLKELEINGKQLPIDIIEDDIRHVKRYADTKPELLICWGDTITHLASMNEIEQFINDCSEILNENGKIILSFRDYSTELSGNNRFIPVKSDDNRILTCFLEYQPDFVRVTDLLYEKSNTGWEQKVSSYNKVRITMIDIMKLLNNNKLTVIFEENKNRVITIIAAKN